MGIADLKQQHCRRDAARLDARAAEELRRAIDPAWTMTPDGSALERDVRFDDYYRTIAFVNALAWIAHREDHHPDLEVGYNHCRVRYSTHSVGGLSENDFICAARVDALVEGDS